MNGQRKEQGQMIRKYLVAKGSDVLGTYSGRRFAVGVAADVKGTLYSIERVEDCQVRLAMDKTFEEAA
jgi:hypothetical protein